MAATSDTIVEIPPPEAAPAETTWWGLATVLLATIVGLVVFVSITEPRVAPVAWTREMGPTGSINLDSLVATTDGFAVLSGMTTDGVLLWSSTDGATWRSQPLQGAPSQLATVGDGLIAYGVRLGRMIAPDGEGWIESAENIVFPDEVRSRQGSGRPSLVGAEDGLIAMSLFGDVWWSTDGTEFDKVVADPDWGPGVEITALGDDTDQLPFDSVCRPPTRTSPDVPPLVETDSGFVAMISSNPAEPFGIWPVCEPQVWLSADGRSWTELDSKLGDGAYVYNLAWRDGRFTAVGGFGIGEPAAWTSEDGHVWELITSLTTLTGVDLYTVEAGPAAWVILGRDSEESDSIGWTSLDGTCWNPLPFEISGADTAITSQHMVILDRTTYPEVWQGAITGGGGSCK
ncbi:MAG: hypothetical protein M3N43_00435 [Actinomycetota bacterium]|nr:hypothetical protein [Actinomycetota bacterium]